MALMTARTLISFVIAAGISPWSAWAFPELTRHGYTYCTACHVSPTGGGILSPYGRELSRELVSTWGQEGEQRPFQGWINTASWEPEFLVGGDVRLIQIYADNRQVRMGRLFLMQAEVEAAYRPGKWTFAGTFGYVDEIGTHRFFAGVSLTEEISIRAGQFYPQFGLNLPEHVFGTRAAMGFDEGQETRNIEFNWSAENWSVVATGALAQSDGKARTQGRKGHGVLTVSRALGTASRVGVSSMHGSVDSIDFKAMAFHGVLGFTPEFFLMTELDWQWRKSATSSSRTTARFAKLGYEVHKGLVPYLLHDGTGSSNGWGGGLQWFPRPHFELHGMIEKIFSPTSQNGGDTSAWLLIHYYL